jgi:hypothetical protein
VPPVIVCVEDTLIFHYVKKDMIKKFMGDAGRLRSKPGAGGKKAKKGAKKG